MLDTLLTKEGRRAGFHLLKNWFHELGGKFLCSNLKQ
jgi:hypothetical protein